MNSATEIILIVGTPIAFVALILDMILRTRWNRWYFNWGFTIYRKEYSVDTQKVLNPNFLEGKMDIPLLGRTLFRRQLDGQIFFRQRFLNINPYKYSLSSYDVMHGIIIQEGTKYTVIGKLDLQFFAMVLFATILVIWPLLVVNLNAIHWLIMIPGIYAIILIFISYRIQVYKYNKIGKLIFNEKVEIHP